MSKKAFLAIASLSLLFLTPLSASAEENASPSSSLHDTKMSVKNTVMQVREDAKALIQQEREAVKAKIAAIKDQRKKTIVERVDTKIPEINTNRTNQMSAALTRMTQILDSISSKSATAKQEGKNTTSLDQAIINAKTAISTAQDAVTTQAGKTYTLTITDDTTLRTTIGTTLKQLTTDLNAVHKKVIAARESVRKAFVELAKLYPLSKNEGKENTASSAAH